MDKFTAISVLNDEIEAEGTDVMLNAWRTLFPDGTPPSPPTALAALATEAAHFASLVDKTGEPANWRTPPQHSEAMEQLTHRLTCLLQAFLDLYDGDDYLPLLVHVYRMITERGMSATDVAGVIFQWSVRDRKLKEALLELRPAASPATAEAEGGAS